MVLRGLNHAGVAPFGRKGGARVDRRISAPLSGAPVGKFYSACGIVCDSDFRARGWGGFIPCRVGMLELPACPSVRVVELVHCSIHLSIWLLIIEMHLCKYQLWFTRSECGVLVQIMLAGSRPLLTVLSFCEYAGWTVCCSV